jgi:hypothetical protein
VHIATSDDEFDHITIEEIAKKYEKLALPQDILHEAFGKITFKS